MCYKEICSSCGNTGNKNTCAEKNKEGHLTEEKKIICTYCIQEGYNAKEKRAQQQQPQQRKGRVIDCLCSWNLSGFR
jgi:hypothetical protein